MQDITTTFEPTELELIAEMMDGFLSVDRGLADAGLTARQHIDPLTRALATDLVRRVRALAAAGVPARFDDLPAEMAHAVSDAAELLSARHGRAAVLRIAPGVVVVCGMRDDVESEWLTVRQIGQLISCERSARDDVAQAHQRLSEMAAGERLAS